MDMFELNKRYFHKSVHYAYGWIPLKIDENERSELKEWFRKEHSDHKIQSFKNEIFLETKEDTGIIFERREEPKNNDFIKFIFIMSIFFNIIFLIGMI